MLFLLLLFLLLYAAVNAGGMIKLVVWLLYQKVRWSDISTQRTCQRIVTRRLFTIQFNPLSELQVI